MSVDKVLGNYINGKFILGQGDRVFYSRNPSKHFQVIGEIRETPEHVEDAIQAAHSALPQWRSLGLDGRAQALAKVAELVEFHQQKIAKTISLEMGKSYAESLVEARSIQGKITTTIKNLNHMLPPAVEGAPGEQRFRPLGVTTVIGPFNFPIHLLNTHVIPALLTGNTVIIKPSEVTPLCGQRYAELFHEAGIPAGVFNMVQGKGDIGAQLTSHPKVNCVIFTGSYATGRHIRQATFDQPFKKVCLELGGKNPAVVLDDADLDQATREILLGALLTSGQRCTATSRVIVTSGVADILKRKLMDALLKIRPSNPFDKNCFIGPLASEAAQERFFALLQQGRSEGAEPLIESVPLAGGAFVTPSMYEVNGDEAYLNEELFGPHISFQVVPDTVAALRCASQNQFGLSASLFTADESNFENFYNEVPAGVLNLNRSTNGASGLLPFGGVGMSGNWHAGGSEGARLSTYPVAMMRLPLHHITENIPLENQLKRNHKTSDS